MCAWSSEPRVAHRAESPSFLRSVARFSWRERVVGGSATGSFPASSAASAGSGFETSLRKYIRAASPMPVDARTSRAGEVEISFRVQLEDLLLRGRRSSTRRAAPPAPSSCTCAPASGRSSCHSCCVIVLPAVRNLLLGSGRCGRPPRSAGSGRAGWLKKRRSSIASTAFTRCSGSSSKRTRRGASRAPRRRGTGQLGLDAPRWPYFALRRAPRIFPCTRGDAWPGPWRKETKEAARVAPPSTAAGRAGCRDSSRANCPGSGAALLRSA